MINLLATNKKNEIRAARNNVLLMRYIWMLILAIVFILSVLYVSYNVLAQTKANNDILIESNDTKAGVYSTTKAQVDSLSSSLSETKTILDQEILYSKVLVKLGQQMPPGTIIDTLTLNQAAFAGTPVSVKVYAKTSNDVVTLRSQFQSSPLFSSVNFQSVVENGGGIEGYPVSIDMTLTLNKAAAR